MAENDKPRVAVMLPRFSRYGGVEQFGYRLSAALAESGFAVDFICARQEAEAPEGVRVLTTGRPTGPQWLKMLVFAKGAEKLRRAGNYDCAFSLGKTLEQDILRVGGGPLRQFWKYSERSFPAGAVRSWKSLKRRLSPANRLTLRIEEKQYDGHCLIAAVSHFVRDLIVEAHPNLKKEDIPVIYNRPDLSRFSPPSAEERARARERFGIEGGTIAVGLATSNFRLKGTGPLIRALTMLPEHYRLYVAGGRNPDSYIKFARDLGVENRVRFLGKVDNMPAFYRALDVFTLPSYSDACSNAVLEALAAGLPVLSSSSNGSSYFLPTEDVLPDPGDSKALAATIKRLAEQAGRTDRGESKRGFDWPDGVESGIEAWVELIRDFISSRK